MYKEKEKISIFRFAKSIRGQITIEALVALSVLVVGFLGAFSLFSRSFFLGRVTTDDYVGTYLAAEGIELVKNMIDNNYILRVTDPAHAWNSGFSSGDFEADYTSPGLASIGSCDDAQELFLDAGGFYGYSAFAGAPTKFKRCIKIDVPSAEEIRVNSIVSWSTGPIPKTIELEDRFFDWRP